MPRATVIEVIAFLEELGAELTRKRTFTIVEKQPANLLTELDKLLEERLREFLPSLWAGSVVVGEEAGGQPADWTWWVDPLDGTTNRVHGWPRSTISVALYHRGTPKLSVVRDPYLKETFWAIEGQGAWLNKRRLVMASDVLLAQALICTGLAPHPQAQWELCMRLQGASRGIRVSGCASLDFAYVAAGRANAFLELDLKPWDVAAGLLLVSEAGGRVVDYRGDKADLFSGNYLAASSPLISAILFQIKDCGL